MDELGELISSPAWWVSVVVVGILVNIVSSYLKPGIDKFASTISAARRETLQEREAEFSTWVAWLCQNPGQQSTWAAEIIDLQVRSNRYVFIVLSLLLVSAMKSFEGELGWIYSLLPVAAFGFYFFSSSLDKEATKRRLALRQARKDVVPETRMHNPRPRPIKGSTALPPARDSESIASPTDSSALRG